MGVQISERQLQWLGRLASQALSQAELLPYRRGSVFANESFYISPESKGATTGAWSCRPFQIGIADAYASPEFYEVVWRKASRMGASKLLCSLLAQCASEFKYNVALYQPGEEDIGSFVKTEIEPMMRDVEALQKVLLSSDGRANKDNTLAMKKLLGSIWHFLGGTSPRAYRRISVDYVILDELSAFPKNVGKEGDPRTLAAKRNTESPMGKIISVSSPKTNPDCQISMALEDMDFQLRFNVPCPNPRCKHEHYMDFDDGRMAHGVIWDVSKNLSVHEMSQTVRYHCPACSQEYSFTDMILASERGRWITEDRKVWMHEGRLYDTYGVIEGQRWSVGFDSNVFVSEALPWSMFVKEYMLAERELRLGQPEKMITVWNTRLGRAWDLSGVTKLEYKQVLERAEDYPEDGRVPQGVLIVLVTADVQGDRIELLFCGVGLGEEMWALDHVVIVGNTDYSAPWDAMERHLENKHFVREDGTVIDIFMMGIDHGGHWTEKVEDFCRNNSALLPARTIPIKGDLGHNKPVVNFNKRPNKDGVWLTTNHTDTSKQIYYNRLSKDKFTYDEVNPGYIHFPKLSDQYPQFDQDFFKQATSETRHILPSGKPEWRVVGRNEVLDLFSMMICLIRICQHPTFGVNLDAEDSGDAIPQKRWGSKESYSRSKNNPQEARKGSRFDFAKMGRELNK